MLSDKHVRAYTTNLICATVSVAQVKAPPVSVAQVKEIIKDNAQR